MGTVSLVGKIVGNLQFCTFSVYDKRESVSAFNGRVRRHAWPGQPEQPE